MKTYFKFLLFAVVVGCSPKQTTEERFEAYARKISGSFLPPDDVAYRTVIKIMEKPLRAYVLEFGTQDPNFKSISDAATNNVSFAVNTGRRLIWEEKFCTDELRQILIEEKVNLISGQILDDSGKTQFIAMCPLNMNH